MSQYKYICIRPCLRELKPKRVASKPPKADWKNNPAVQRFREYLRIPSVHPDVNYDPCVVFLTKQATLLDLAVRVVEPKPKKPVIIMTWPGLQPELPSIMLNSHMDVVPVYEESWTHPPFAAEMTEDGWIYGRGAQDMKVIAIMQMEAVSSLKKSGVKLKRTIHITFVPDEETGSHEGMRVFVDTKHFQEMNVGFTMDEALPYSGSGSYITFTDERVTWHIIMHCPGTPGHGSLLPSDTAGEKLYYILHKFLKYRAEEKSKVDAGGWIGDVTSVNLTKISGGVQINVLPESLTAGFDIRIGPNTDPVEFENQIKAWCEEAGNVTYEFTGYNPVVPATKADESNPFWMAIKNTVEGMNIALKNIVCPGATDARFIRAKGIPAVGFTPINETPVLAHAHDERVHVEQFLKGIEVMKKVVQALGNVK